MELREVEYWESMSWFSVSSEHGKVRSTPYRAVDLNPRALAVAQCPLLEN